MKQLYLTRLGLLVKGTANNTKLWRWWYRLPVMKDWKRKDVISLQNVSIQGDVQVHMNWGILLSKQLITIFFKHWFLFPTLHLNLRSGICLNLRKKNKSRFPVLFIWIYLFVFFGVFFIKERGCNKIVNQKVSWLYVLYWSIHMSFKWFDHCFIIFYPTQDINTVC